MCRHIWNLITLSAPIGSIWNFHFTSRITHILRQCFTGGWCICNNWGCFWSCWESAKLLYAGGSFWDPLCSEKHHKRGMFVKSYLIILSTNVVHCAKIKTMHCLLYVNSSCMPSLWFFDFVSSEKAYILPWLPSQS